MPVKVGIDQKILRPIKKYLNNPEFKKYKVWTKDNKPSNLGYDSKENKIVVYDFGSIKRQYKQYDWSAMIDDPSTPSDLKRVLFEAFTKGDKTQENLFYHCAFMRNLYLAVKNKVNNKNKKAFYYIGNCLSYFDKLSEIHSEDMGELKRKLEKSYDRLSDRL
jgi:hypothetical protein